ncbi:DUF1302 domain-containing protein [Sinimarinibacterium flocculans]|uniref:Uncharacterized protein DUF1302 n=1 Tax=Sinimarinibacterium flocculans TaxID=985250 RepID=A0A318E2S8_9GAMM|nr:DUF1302 domain-containing protein [Sinimarinibacterium flocculans]PXV65295.1 uncharacterized protein DUF1302 [Sinimarinibacterium flocculans]
MTQHRSWGRPLTAACVLAAWPLGAAPMSLSMGGIEGRLDTSVSLGATFRMADPDAASIGISNGGLARTANEDDGNLGFARGDVAYAVAKATHDLELRRGDFGVFTRFSYFFDAAADEADRREARFDAAGLPTRNREAETYELGSRGRDKLATHIDLLDLFAFGRFDVGGRNLSVRFGNQVVSWGESTFIGNGINAINPIDVARFRAPGAEIREALKPIPMLWTSLQLTSTLSAEAVWMTSFNRTEIDPRGAFFSTNDTVSTDGDKVFVSFGRRKDDNSAITSPLEDPAASVWLPRDRDDTPDDGTDQYGLALRWFANLFGGTEFGFYYLNYHSRTPLLSVVQGSNASPGSSGTNALNGALPRCSENATVSGCRASYFVEYPEGIDLYGISFNSSGPFGIAIQGEYSFRPNQPVQISGPELVMASLGVSNSVTGQGFVAIDESTQVPEAILTPPGTVITGYERVDVHQLQATLTKAFGPQLGAQQFITLAEIGVTRQDLPDDQFFAGPGVALPAPGSGLPIPGVRPDGAAAGGSIQTEGFATRSSWGYRLVSSLTYENVLGPASLSPRLVFAHDVNGVSSTFNQDTKSLTVGIGMNYLQRWQADLSYTSFFGGRTYAGTDLIPAPAGQTQDYATSANPNGDRDFLAVSLSYAF